MKAPSIMENYVNFKEMFKNKHFRLLFYKKVW